jgi:methionine aminopeptidase
MITRRSPTELEKMHQANVLVARVLDELTEALEPGLTTADLDRLAEQSIRKAGAEPAFKGYRGFPAEPSRRSRDIEASRQRCAFPSTTKSCMASHHRRGSFRKGTW